MHLNPPLVSSVEYCALPSSGWRWHHSFTRLLCVFADIEYWLEGSETSVHNNGIITSLCWEVPTRPRLKMAADRRHPTHMCVFEVDTSSGLDTDAEGEFTEITWIGYTIVDFKERDVSDTA